MITCKICNREFKNNNSLAKHLSSHNMSRKEYYDMYIKKNNEGLCKVCNAPTTFRTIGRGYLKFCSYKCSYQGANKKDINKGRKQSVGTIRKRITNTNQKKKEEQKQKTLLKKYGVTNYSQTKEGKEKLSKAHKGTKKPRTKDHQMKIISSKRSNGNLKHTKETKFKIGRGVSGERNGNWNKPPSKNTFSYCLSGYYNGIFFRSSLEMSLLISMSKKNIKITSAETKDFSVPYCFNNKNKNYFPDFYIPSENLVIEIKPSNLLGLKINQAKIRAAQNKFSNFKVLTEKEICYISPEEVDYLIGNGELIILDKKKLEKYKENFYRRYV